MQILFKIIFLNFHVLRYDEAKVILDYVNVFYKILSKY